MARLRLRTPSEVLSGIHSDIDGFMRLKHAHDVRRLRICDVCNDLGDVNDMPTYNGASLHGGCILKQFGLEALLELPEDEVKKVRLGDVGATVMKVLLDRTMR